MSNIRTVLSKIMALMDGCRIGFFLPCEAELGSDGPIDPFGTARKNKNLTTRGCAVRKFRIRFPIVMHGPADVRNVNPGRFERMELAGARKDDGTGRMADPVFLSWAGPSLRHLPSDSASKRPYFLFIRRRIFIQLLEKTARKNTLDKAWAKSKKKLAP